MASSSAIIPREKRYDVFLSFRGEDTRNGFTGHLHEALCNKQILTFIDNNLQRGGDISPSLLTVIQESAISLIIFSENYADSRWCLKELAKIIQCKHLNGQIVIPVFCGVDPSHVRNQIGEFGVAFDKLKERLPKGDMDFNEMRSHLQEAANISGWNSQDISESELIKSIVGDVLNKLNRMTKTLNLSSNLVGIGSHVERVETLLCLELPKFCIVGLWGMGGIGKTTVAKAVFRHIYKRFEASHFVENVSNELKSQSVDGLREKIMLKLFEEERLNMGNRTLCHDFVMEQFQRKTVLIVLDDVEDATKAKDLLGGQNDHLFSGGCRILVTSRDKQVLKILTGDQNLIYEVEGLNEEEALQLFSLGAFKQNYPTSNFLGLSRRVMSYTRGNPLALVVLGNALFDKNKEEWESALDKLGGALFPGIHEVLRISYDALSDEQKMIFLDIAFFLVGRTMDFVVAFYQGRVEGIKFMISNLVDKSLVTISFDKKLEMHDLLKEMGRSIESVKTPKERRRILDLKALTLVSKKRKKGSLMIEAISVDLSQGERISEFHCSVISRLDSLGFLEFRQPVNEESKVRFCWEEFRGFSDELRYLRWDAYPQKSLPSNFCVENLVELHMSKSAIRNLWTGKQNIVNLKVINLHASKLVEFPDVSEGKNIEEINLSFCKSLVKVSPSVQHLPKLKNLSLQCTQNVEIGPTTFGSKLLDYLRLSPGFRTFPEFASGNNVRFLSLDGTDIREVPSSVELLKRLETMSMWGCKKLSIISTNICKLKSLSQLVLRGCTNLESFPEIMEPMESLTVLDLSGCTRLKKLPNSFHNLKSLNDLCLDGTAIVELPSSIQHLIRLQELNIFGCQNLTSLPSCIVNLRNLEAINANGCVSLRTISSASESKATILKFANCLNWDEGERGRALDIAFSNLSQRNLDSEISEWYQIMLPWSNEFPHCFGGSQSVGPSLTLKVSMGDEGCFTVAFFVLVKQKPNSSNHHYYNYLQCCVGLSKISVTAYELEYLSNGIEHLLLWHNFWDGEKFRRYSGREISLRFVDAKGEVEVTRCGVTILPVEDTGNAGC